MLFRMQGNEIESGGTAARSLGGVNRKTVILRACDFFGFQPPNKTVILSEAPRGSVA
jgi:hypothetical protein